MEEILVIFIFFFFQMIITKVEQNAGLRKALSNKEGQSFLKANMRYYRTGPFSDDFVCFTFFNVIDTMIYTKMKLNFC